MLTRPTGGSEVNQLWVGGVRLTKRQLDILQLLRQGKTNKQIGERLKLSPRTVEKYASNDPDDPRAIFPRIGVTHREGAMSWSRERLDSRGDAEGPPSPGGGLVPEAPPSLYEDLVEVYRRQSGLLYQLRIQGNAPLARDKAFALSGQIRTSVRKLSPSRAAQTLERILAEVLYEQAVVCTEISSTYAIWRETEPIVRECMGLANESGDEDLFGRALLTRGDVYYIRKQYIPAIKVLARALDFVKGDDAQLRLRRILAVCLAHQGEKDEFKKVRAEIRGRIERGQFSTLEHVCLAKEGLARGEGILKLSEAFTTFQDGWDIIAKAEASDESAPIRKVQLATSELEIIRLLGAESQQSLEARLARYRPLAERFPRHRKRMEKVVKNPSTKPVNREGQEYTSSA